MTCHLAMRGSVEGAAVRDIMVSHFVDPAGRVYVCWLCEGARTCMVEVFCQLTCYGSGKVTSPHALPNLTAADTQPHS